MNQRYAAIEDRTAVDIACEAADRLFGEWNADRKSTDFIIFSIQSSSYFLPASSCVLQHRLGISTTAGAFDYGLGCSGYTYGLAMAKGFIDSGLTRNVLLFTGDTISKYLHPEDKNRMLFGDSATAALISSGGLAETEETVYGTDGNGVETIIVKDGGSGHFARTGHEEKDGMDNVRRDDYFYMSGEQVFNFTTDRVPQLIDDTPSKSDVKKEHIDYYVSSVSYIHL